MKTLKELQEHGINYLIGYTDALADFAHLLADDPYHNKEMLKVMNAYLTEMLREAAK